MANNNKIALIIAATDKASAVFNKVFHNAEAQAKRLKNIGSRFSEIGDRALITGGIATAFFAKTIHDARESEIAQKKLIQGFITMGSTVKRAKEQIDLAGQLQFKWGVEDEDIMNVQGKLSTFKRAMTDAAIRSGVFQRATQAAFDMQAKGFGDAMSNITALGKALQNPALGSMALARAGAINKEDLPIIKQIQATKGGAAAQMFLLKAIEKQVKGTAAQMADPLKIMELQFHETSEAIGRQLLPAVQKFAQKIADAMPGIMAFIEKHGRLIMMVAKAAVGLLAFGVAMKVVSFGMKALQTGYELLSLTSKLFNGTLLNGSKIAALAARAYEGLKYALFAIQYATKFAVLPALQSAGAAILGFGKALLLNPITLYIAAAAALAGVVYLIVRNWGAISAFFGRVWAGALRVFRASVNAAKVLLLPFTPAFIIKSWQKIGSFFAGIWNSVKQVFSNAWNWLAGLGTRFVQAGKNIVTSIAKGIWAVATAPIRAIMWIVKKIRNFLPFSPAKEGPLRDIHKVRIAETVAATIHAKPLINSWAAATRGLRMQMVRPQAVAIPISSGVASNIHFNPVINLHGSASQADARRISGQVRAEFDRMMKDHEARKSRRNY